MYKLQYSHISHLSHLTMNTNDQSMFKYAKDTHPNSPLWVPIMKNFKMQQWAYKV